MMSITPEDLRLFIAYGIALGSVPAFTALMVGIFWRVIHIMS